MIAKFYIINMLALVCGFVLDLIIGDPRQIPHPICFIGNLISKTEKKIRKATDTSKQEKTKGVLLTITVIKVTAIITLSILFIAYKINVKIYFAVCIIMCWQILATKSLKDESMKVYTALTEKTIEEARYAVSMIVGRDTANLSAEGVAKATIETVAENTCDGVIAPMFYCILGGPVLGFVYKAINTMDSMVGYKNKKYINFGTAAAKLDDYANYIPARLSALFMIMAAFIGGFNGRNAFKVYKKDRKKHASPNSAQTESVCAGALEIQLAGDAVYGGVLHKKQFIGDKITPVENFHIKSANKLMYITAVLFLSVTTAAVVILTKGGNILCF